MVDDDGGTCPQCGSSEHVAATAVQRLGQWFRYGGRPSSHRCVSCGALWGDYGGVTLFRPRAAWLRWLRLPYDLVETLRHARTWEPVLRFYAIVGGVALGPAIVAAASWPRRRWLILVGTPVAAMAGAFASSLASAPGRQVRRSIGLTLTPRRSMEREFEADIAAIRAGAADLPVLVPVDWDGEVRIGGHGSSAAPDGTWRLSSISVVADDGTRPPHRPQRELVIEVSDEPDASPDEGLLEEFARRELDRTGSLPPPPDTDDDDAITAWIDATEHRRQERAAELAGAWEVVTLEVDGAPVAARAARAGAAAIASFRYADHDVQVHGLGVALGSLRLRRTTDVEPLIAAMRRFYDAVLHHHPEGA
jgi:hypothetical protein